MSPSDSLLCFCRPAVVTTFLRFRSLLVNARSLFPFFPGQALELSPPSCPVLSVSLLSSLLDKTTASVPACKGPAFPQSRRELWQYWEHWTLFFRHLHRDWRVHIFLQFQWTATCYSFQSWPLLYMLAMYSNESRLVAFLGNRRYNVKLTGRKRRSKTPNLVWISWRPSCGTLLIITTTPRLSVAAWSPFGIRSVTISPGWKMITLWFRPYFCFTPVRTSYWKSWTWAVRAFCSARSLGSIGWGEGWSLLPPREYKGESESLCW